MTTQIDLIPAHDDARALAAADRQRAAVDRLLAVLQGRRWLHASGIVEIARGSGWDGRAVRRLVNAAGGRIIATPDRGYCRTDEARPEEVRHCLSSLESRAAHFARRAQAIWTQINRPQDSQIDWHFDQEDAAAVHRVLLSASDWLTNDQLRIAVIYADGPEIGPRRIQEIAEESEGQIIGHPAKGYRHAWRASGPELAHAWRTLISRQREIARRIAETQKAAHALLARRVKAAPAA